MRRAGRGRGRAVYPVMRIGKVPALAVVLATPAGLPDQPCAAADAIVRVFVSAAVEFDQDLSDPTPADGYSIRSAGQVIERTIELPTAPARQRDAQRITATVRVRPVLTETKSGRMPGDVWSRVGSVSVVVGGDASTEGRSTEVELMRFATGFGGRGTFTQDVTPFAPLLYGEQTVRLFISTYTRPAWDVDLVFTYRADDAGYRRPVYVGPLFNETAVTADEPSLAAVVDIPEGLARPRVRVLSTGHSTDGGPENEFVTCTHVLRIDGREIARWRPWSEDGARLREHNPWSGRQTIDGREVRSSDLDRSGWNPGSLVEPLLLPAPELTPGSHRVELEILGIRPEGREHAHGYWRVSGSVVADEPWPGKG